MGYYYDTQLYHHGIPGQKWGDRNGPPYPLDSKEHNEVVERKEKKGLTDKQKKVLKTSATIVAACLVTYGGYKLATSTKARSIANNILQGNKDKRLADIDKEIASLGPEIVKKSKNEFGSIDTTGHLKELFKDLPKRDVSEVDDFFLANQNRRLGTNHPGFEKNCLACALQNALSKSGITGYKARSSLQADPVSGMVTQKAFALEDVRDAFEGTKLERIKGNNWKDVRTQISKLGNGATGVLGNTRTREGVITRHAISFEVKNGKAIFSDNQSANVLADRFMKRGFKESTARKMAYSFLSDLSDDYLNKSSIFSNLTKDDVVFIRIDNAIRVIPENLDKLLYM